MQGAWCAVQCGGLKPSATSYFLEKRTFFLQNAEVFDFSGLGGGFRQQDVVPFFSRTIGLGLHGERVPLLAGGKRTGRAGRYDVGVIDVRTRAAGAVPGQNFLVGRVVRNLGRQSYIGGLATSGNPGSRTRNILLGADARYARSDFFGNRTSWSIYPSCARSSWANRSTRG